MSQSNPYKVGLVKDCQIVTLTCLSLFCFQSFRIILYYLLRSRAARDPLLGLDVVHTDLAFVFRVIHVTIGVDHVVLVIDGSPLVLDGGVLQDIGLVVLVLVVLLDVILLVLLGRALGGVRLHGLGRLRRGLGLVRRLLDSLLHYLLDDLLDRLGLSSLGGLRLRLGLSRLGRLLHDLLDGLGLGLRLLDGGVGLLNQRLELASVLAAPHAVGLLLGVVLAEVSLADLLELAAVAKLVGLVVAHHLGLAALNVLLLVKGASAAADVALGLGLRFCFLRFLLSLLLLLLRLLGSLVLALGGRGLVVAGGLGLLGLLRCLGHLCAGNEGHIRQELRTKLLLGEAGSVLASLGTQVVGGEEHVVEVDHHGEGHGCLCGLVRGVRKVWCVTRFYP